MKKMNNVVVFMAFLHGLVPCVSRGAMEPAQAVGVGVDVRRSASDASEDAEIVYVMTQEPVVKEDLVLRIAGELSDWSIAASMIGELVSSAERRVTPESVEQNLRQKVGERLVAFSQRKIHQLSEKLKDYGYDCAAAISQEPEQRKEQSEKTNALLVAINNADMKGVAKAFEEDAQCMRSLFDGEVPPVMYAVQQGHVNVVGALLDLNADIESVRKSDSATALMIACENEHLPMVRFLLKRNANVHVADVNGFGALHKACISQNNEMQRLLIEVGAQVDQLTTESETPLMFASGAGDINAVRMLVEARANVNAASAVVKMTSLCAASAGGHFNVVEFLLQSKADPCQAIKEQKTALSAAVIAEDIAIVRLLLEAKADPRVVHDSGHTAFDYAYSPEMRALLMAAKIVRGVAEILEQKQSDEVQV